MQMSLLTVECASTATQEAIKEKKHVQEGEKVIYAAVDKYHKDSLVIYMLILWYCKQKGGFASALQKKKISLCLVLFWGFFGALAVNIKTLTQQLNRSDVAAPFDYTTDNMNVNQMQNRKTQKLPQFLNTHTHLNLQWAINNKHDVQ